MAKVEVPRAQITELLGLPPDVDDKTLNRELEKALARANTTALSAAEQRARAEDRRIVVAAVSDGRIVASRAEFWCEALKKDRIGNRAVIASLAAALPPAERVVDEGVERVHGQILARLGRKPIGAKSPRTVAASSPLPPPSSHIVDDLGLPIPQVPPPVRIRQGTPPDQWTWKQHSDFFQRQLGQKFWPGTEPLPAQDVWYQPSPNDPYEYVEGEGWRPNPNYRPGD